MVVLTRLAAVALAAASACGSPSISEGTIACGPGGSCPDGFSCAANGRCYRGPLTDATASDAAHTDAPPDTPSITLDCASYCAAIATACVSANQQYGSVATCMATCQYVPLGALTDTSGNTLGCRIHQTELARAAPSASCVPAGPSGGGVCGQPCEGFCTLVLAVCPSAFTAGMCSTDCAQMPAGPPFSTAAQSGDSVSCRFYYATLAATDPATNCQHVGTSSGMCQ